MIAQRGICLARSVAPHKGDDMAKQDPEERPSQQRDSGIGSEEGIRGGASRDNADSEAELDDTADLDEDEEGTI
jgi:hypothetical protein